MLKSPEEYLSGISFEPPETGSRELTSGERIFVEKYLGLDAMELLPELVPEQIPLRLPVKTPERPKIIEVVQEEPVATEDFSAKEPAPVIKPGLELEFEKSIPVSVPVMELEPVVKILEIADVKEEAAESTDEKSIVDAKSGTIIAEESEQKILSGAIEASPDKQEIMVEATTELATTAAVEDTAISAQDDKSVPVEQTIQAPAAAVSTPESEIPVLPSLREKLKDEPEIQMVSFFISGQLFLLPVIAIQEVLRYQELIKVPQAPDFVAGVINLRGRVTPLVYLSSLLTNSKEQNFTEKNFIIICGTPQLQIGLIIDRIKSMHLMPQKKIIWNAEAKLGDAAEFLCAIADLDDKVCGIVAPENIAQKILAP